MSDPRPIKLFIIGACFTFAVIVALILILVPPQGLQ
jgi:preprotein translocase subunit Sec61beta